MSSNGKVDIMIKKEIHEIKKQLSKERLCLDFICGCYVDDQKEKTINFKKRFLALPEEEVFKYLEILKKCFSGSIGKQLLNISFPVEQEQDGGCQEILLKLRDSKLQHEDMLEKFYANIIKNYMYSGKMLIMLVHGIYDIPGKTLDNEELFDASDEVYEFIQCCICPVELSKPGLVVNPQKADIEERERDWLIGMPMHAFLFPSFNDRNSDIHECLYYSKKASLIQPDFMRNILGCKEPESCDNQAEIFHSILQETYDGQCDFKTMQCIHQNLNCLIEESKDSAEKPLLGKTELKKILKECDASEEQLSRFDEAAGDFPDMQLHLDNLTNPKSLTIKTDDAVLKIDSECIHDVSVQVIDGRSCLVVPVEGKIELQGMDVKAFLE